MAAGQERKLRDLRRASVQRKNGKTPTSAFGFGGKNALIQVKSWFMVGADGNTTPGFSPVLRCFVLVPLVVSIVVLGFVVFMSVRSGLDRTVLRL
ncbi:uncharacterized protein V6R79_003712 [Siganus canaliculatus]